MSTVDWDLITQTFNSNDSCHIFIDKLLKIYDEAFPFRKITMKTKNLGSAWITYGIKKSSKKEQQLHEKSLRSKTART